MKKILIAFALMAFPIASHAQQQVTESVSSATWCNFQVSSLTYTRADNFNLQCPEGLLTGRVSLRIVNGAGTLYGGFDINVSTISTNVKYGEVINPTDKIEMELSSAMTYYLKSAPAATLPYVLVQQARSNFAR